MTVTSALINLSTITNPGLDMSVIPSLILSSLIMSCYDSNQSRCMFEYDESCQFGAPMNILRLIVRSLSVPVEVISRQLIDFEPLRIVVLLINCMIGLCTYLLLLPNGSSIKTFTTSTDRQTTQQTPGCQFTQIA